MLFYSFSQGNVNGDNSQSKPNKECVCAVTDDKWYAGCSEIFKSIKTWKSAAEGSGS